MQLRADSNTKFSYTDYLTWPEDTRCELINGVVYNMSPAPSPLHQQVSWEVSGQIRNYLKSKKCRGFSAPVDVTFPEQIKIDDDIYDMVEPDILVVCDSNKIGEKRIHGAPDFIIEVISPSSASRDYVIKARLYEKNGVKEYWIIEPVNRIVHKYLLNEKGKYVISAHEGKGKLEVKTLKGLTIDFDLVFE